ncbi:hypothetical protein ABHI18_000570 [Aspergillus niger]
MDTGKTAIARIPNPNAGPTILTTASEVATMDLVIKDHTSYSSSRGACVELAVNSTNRVGAEYIVMENATGSNLADVWADMDLEHKVQTMKDIVKLQQKLLSLRFSVYGCLFNQKDAPPGSQPAIVEGDKYPLEVRQKIAERFSIGPVVDTAFWSNERGSMNIDRGPWTSAIDYIRALANREMSWIKEYAIPHILGSFLWHTDLRTPNIFVDNSGHITSIIDWQSTWAGPLFLEGRHPHFLDYAGDLILKPPKNFKQLDNDTQKNLREKISRSIILYLYEKYTAKKNPLLDKVLRYPNGKILTHPIPLYPTTKCPITFTPNGIHKHHEDSEGWNEVQDFWDALSGILNRDGWTSHETYDQAVSIYSQIQDLHDKQHSKTEDDV